MESENNTLKRQTAVLSVASNTTLVLLKLAVGLFTGAVSIISEAAHSAVDLVAAIIAFYAVKKSGKPPDEDHAYGHGKYENLSGAVEALLIVLAAVWIIYEAVDKLQNGGAAPEFLEYGIAIMVISIIINYWVSGRLMKVARQTESQALEADGLHLRADIWTSAGVLAGLVAIKITGMPWLDPVIAIAVAGIIFRAGYRMTVESTRELTDCSLPEEEEKIIGAIIAQHAGVIAFHRLRTRRSGSYRLIDVHLIMDRNMHLDKAHEICDQLEGQIKGELGLCDVVIHAEPCGYYADFGACPRPQAPDKDRAGAGRPLDGRGD